ncbi:VPLPA-CTERM sorting domain-containing protein [Tropicibacter sp. S64]|uniref:VPLPA-CTERM sorting domain-containing protein n=1 Tax=Tropicibacter sp. S64 TaxID=3415122 RepID=UPI003C7991CD
MIRTTLAALAALCFTQTADALPITYEMDVTASYGSAYGGGAILAPITWTFGFTYDPDTIVPTTQGSGNGNTSTFYGQGSGVTGYLRKGSDVAPIDWVEAQFSTASLNRHSFTIRYVVDGRNPLWDPACFSVHRYACPDLDQNDGMSFTTAQGGASIIDLNQVQFSFGGNNTTPTYFTAPGTLATTSLAWLGDAQVLRSTNMSVYGYGIAGSQYGVLTATQDPTASALRTVSAVPLPASAVLLVGALGGLAAMRRRKRAI